MSSIEIKAPIFEVDPDETEHKTLWQHAWQTLLKDKLAVISLIIVILYSLVAICTALGIMGGNWADEIGPAYTAPNANAWFGTDIFGRSVLMKTIKGTEVAMSVGLITALISGFIGLILGAVAGYFGGKIDELIVWFYTTVSSIPYIILLIAITFILGKGLIAVYLALGLTSWVNLCRLIRGEVMRHKEREYVHAASAIGGGHFRKLFLHIIPNVTHIVIINFSLQFQVAIKSEVICLLYTSPSPRDQRGSRMPSSA